MKTIYTRPLCPACHVLKAKLTKEGVAFRTVTVIEPDEPHPPGVWWLRSSFEEVFPGVRSFPFVVEGE